jgi:predicted metal-dependent phosphoesterase TrpH
MKYYQAEMHCHTREVSPCSRIPAKYLVRGYIEMDYRYVFITDHYHSHNFDSDWAKATTWDELVDYLMSGYHAAKAAAEGTNLRVMMGVEITLNTDKETGLGSDFLLYGFDEAFLRANPYLHHLSFQAYYEMVRAEGFLTFQAHPYRYGMEPIWPVCYDGIEIVNAHPAHHSRNQMAIKFALENGLYMIGGSDAHTEEDAGRGGIMLPDGIETPSDLVAFYRENGSPELIVTFGA